MTSGMEKLVKYHVIVCYGHVVGEAWLCYTKAGY